MIFPVTINIKKVLIGMGLGLVILLFLTGAFAFSYYSAFLRASGLTFSELTITARTGYFNRQNYQDRKVPFLFLGLDRRDDAFEKTVLTDTILLGSLDTKTGNVTTIAIPRDLWIADLQTKINALYFYGQKQNGSSGIRFTKEEITHITGMTPEFVVVLNYLELPNLIDTLGGVEVYVENSFEDKEYPNPAYLEGVAGITPYTTVTFEQGVETMDGARALVYIRSRGSTDPLEGSDIARAKRQMIMLESLIRKFKSKAVLRNPTILGKLYRFWQDNVETTLTDSDIVSLGILLRDKPVSIRSIQIPVTGESAVLINPPISKYGLWVWEARGGDWSGLQELIKANL